jgi:ABC-type lipoprotein release transport system permease subunit
MVVGSGVKKTMHENYYKEYFNFIKPDGSVKKVLFGGVFDSDIELEANDVIVMSKTNVRDIFELSEEMATDIVVRVSNPNEIDTIALKIKQIMPEVRVITNEAIKVNYENIFNYKSGIFLALFIISIFTFFIIIYDKASGLSSEEKKEVGILKAIGWKVEDVLKEKFYESFIISFFAYILGITISLMYVYLFQAPLIRDIFIGYSNLKPSFELPFVFDIQTLVLVFFLSVPIYIASIIIPSWRVATLDADEVIR